MANVFVDSNIVVYAMDRNGGLKRSRCRAWLSRLGPAKAMTLSVQVLNEAYATLTGKHGLHPEADGVRRTLEDLARWMTAPLDWTVVQAAWGLQDRYRIHVWDALLLASANAAGCTHFLSEDLNEGQRYGGVTAVNPFRHLPEDVLGPALP